MYQSIKRLNLVLCFYTRNNLFQQDCDIAIIVMQYTLYPAIVLRNRTCSAVLK